MQATDHGQVVFEEIRRGLMGIQEVNANADVRDDLVRSIKRLIN
jgi:hypothetical protein